MIDGMSCGHCTAAVTQAMESVPNSGNVVVDLEKKEASWDGSASAEDMKKVVDAQGFVARAE